MVHCAAINCSNDYDKNKSVSYHKLPNDKKIADMWIKKISRTELPRHVYLCSNHFKEDCFDTSHDMMQNLLPSNKKSGGRRLIKGAIPTIFSYASVMNIRSETKRRCKIYNPLSEDKSDSIENPLGEELTNTISNIGTQTDSSCFLNVADTSSSTGTLTTTTCKNKCVQVKPLKLNRKGRTASLIYLTEKKKAKLKKKLAWLSSFQTKILSGDECTSNVEKGSHETSSSDNGPEHVGIGEQGHETVVCDYCQSSVEKNRFGQREELLICKDCGNKAHPSCLNYLPELVEQIRADDSWQCIDCKACVICNGTGDPDTLLFCDACDKGYHMQCHAPKLEKMPSGKWACASCVEKGKSVSTPSGTQQQPVFIVDAEVNSHAKRNVTGNGEKLLSTVPVQKIEPQIAKTKAAMVPQPVLSVHQPGAVYHPTGLTFTQPPIVSPVAIPPVQHLPLNQPQMIPVNYAVLPNTSTPPAQTVLGRGVHNNLTHILNPKLPLPDVRSSIREDVLRALPPDVADWTVQDVAYYFKSHGYVLESKLLEEQEIDGRAMLLMSRNDCLTGLHIKLGPALKIYHMHIHKLQKRTEFLG